ncbi:MAG: thiol reductase thioredoxin, partial [Bacteroidetes bacterium]|nr:thiol reductase thioredoxin [Bacteroidota bacterium]
YISKKVNAETDEGPKLAKQFKVSAYPTLIFLDQNGKILLQTEGARTKNQLIKLGKQAKRKM